MQNSTVRLESSEGIAVVTLDKPPVNAFDLTLINDAESTLRSVETDSETRAVVITGNGKCFSAGLDLKTVPSYSPAEQRRMVEDLNRTVAWLYGFPLPTVAAINGHAIAGGFILAITCDYRIGADMPCKLGVTESRVGIPFPVSTMEVLRAELAPSIARRMTLVGSCVGPKEALSSGILDEIQTPDTVLNRAKEIAKELGAMPSEAYMKIKRQLRGHTIAQMEASIREKNDPLLKIWIGEEARMASAKHLDPKGRQ
jgi:enoyl-CoA hydratase